MKYKLLTLVVCFVLAGCMGQDGAIGSSTVSSESAVPGAVANQDGDLDLAAKFIASEVSLEEFQVTDEVEEGELLTGPAFEEAPQSVALRGVVGDYEVGGYACTIVHNPEDSIVWSIQQYNLNDSLNTNKVIFGLTQNRKIQSVSCTPDGSYALFSVKDSRNGDYEVYSVDLITDKISQLTDNDTDDVDVSMDVDGLKMAWQERLADGRQAIAIRTYNPDRTNFTQKGLASANPLVQPSLSPNGQWMALVQLRPSNFLALRYDVENAKFMTVKSIVRRKKLFQPSVSNDGNIFGWLENNNQGRYVVKNLLTNVSTLLLKNPVGEGIRHPMISFDGEWVIYSYNNPDTRQTLLTNISTGETANVGGVLASPARYLGASWMGTIIYPQEIFLETTKASVSESGVSFQGSLVRSGAMVEPLTVSLESSDLSELKIPSSVTFAKGEVFKSFVIQPIDDNEIDGTQTVTISASALGTDTVTADIDVLDDGELLPELSLVTSASNVRETGGSVKVTISVADPVTQALKVSLASSDSSQVTMPASVSIPAGEESVEFLVKAVKDYANDGRQTVTITASALGLESGTATLTVLDDPVAEVDEIQVSFDASGNLSVYDIGDKTTSEIINLNLQTEDGVTYLQINDANEHVIQINQAGSDVFFTKPAKRTAVRVPVDLVNSLTVDTKEGINQVDLRADLSLPKGINLISDTVNIIGATVKTFTGSALIEGHQAVLLSSGSIESTTGQISLLGNYASESGCLGVEGSFKGVELLSDSSIKTFSGDVLVGGCGGTTDSKNMGVRLGDSGGSIVASGSGSIQVVGYAGKGDSNNIGLAIQGSASFISSLSGDITLEGVGSSENTGEFNPGLAVQNGAKVILSGSLEDFKTKKPSMTIVGKGGNETSGGLVLNGAGSELSVKDAPMYINGVAGNHTPGAGDLGVYLSGLVTSKGSAPITITGDEIGVLATTVSTLSGKLSVVAGKRALFSKGQLSTTSGDVLLSGGIAGNECQGHSGNFTGVELLDISKIETIGGNISIKGCGGDTDSKNMGIRLGDSGGKIVATGNGNISLFGIAGKGSDNNIGVAIQGGDSILSSKAGSIDISGVGSTQSTGLFNPGVAIQNGGQIVSLADQSDFTTTSSVQVKIAGKGMLSSGSGVVVGGSGSQIFTKDAPLHISGTNAVVTEGSDLGVYLSGLVQAKGSASISILGSDIGVLDSSVIGLSGGVLLSADRTIVISDGKVKTVSGGIDLSANMKADACAGQKGNFKGVELLNISTIESESGNTTVRGCGGTIGSKNMGIRLADSGGKIITKNGDLKLLGISGKGTDNNIGVVVQGADSYVSTIAGSIDITGVGSEDSSGEFNPGVSVQEGGHISSASGLSKHLNITGSGGKSFQESNHGVSVSSSGSITTSHAALTITGTGGGKSLSAGKNMGVYVNALISSTGVAPINIVGRGGFGDSDNDAVRVGGDDSEIKSLTGDIIINGVGSQSTFGDGNKGVRVSTGGKVTAMGEANITIYGEGGGGKAKNQGIHVVGSVITGFEEEAIVSAVNGDITLNGIGNPDSTGNANTGVNIVTNGFVETTGSGSIDVLGLGGAGGINHYGVGLFNGGEIRTKGTGGIKIDGTGGVGNLGNSGLRLAGQLPQENPNHLPLLYAKISSADGPIEIVAQGGNGDGGTPPTEAPWSEEDHGMQGIYLNHGGWIEALGNATIDIETTGGDGYNETHGLFMEGEENFEPGEVDHKLGLTSYITSVDGDINILGYGNLNNPVGNSFGVGLVFSQINSSGSGNINIRGVGGSGTKRPTHGIQVNQEVGLISTTNGSITLSGEGGVGTGNGNVGVKVVDGAHVSVLGGGMDASIKITGTGGDFGNNANHGVQIGNASSSDETTSVDAINGDVEVIGIAGGSGTGENNFGVSLSGSRGVGGGQITSTGLAKVKVHGTGGFGVNGNGGVQVAVGDSKITSVDGDISVTGVASTISEGEANAGIFLQLGGKIESTGSGSITVHGTGGNGSKINEGVALLDNEAAISSADGNVSITAIAGAGAEDLRFYDPTQDAVNYIGGADATGKITLNVNTLHSVFGSVESSGALVIRPRSPDVSIGIGAGVDDGTLNVSAAEFSGFVDGFSKITIGRADASIVTVGSLVASDPVDIQGRRIEGVTSYPRHIVMVGNENTATLTGVVSPRRSTGGQSLGMIVTSGRIKFAQSAIFEVSLKGLRPGNAHDQLLVDESLNINGAALKVKLIEGYEPTVGSSYVIVENSGTSDILGNFTGLSEGGRLMVDGFGFTISYKGGDGNDVVLSFDP